MITITTISLLASIKFARLARKVIGEFFGANPGAGEAEVRNGLFPRLLDVAKDVFGVVPDYMKHETFLGQLVSETVESLEENDIWEPGKLLNNLLGAVSNVAGGVSDAAAGAQDHIGKPAHEE